MTSDKLERMVHAQICIAQVSPDINIYEELERLVKESPVRFVRDATWILAGYRNSVRNSVTSKSREYNFEK